MRICYVPYDGFGPAGFYRLVFPFREMQKHGHWAKTPFYNTILSPDGKKGLNVMDMSRLPNADVYVFQMPLDAEMLVVVRTLRRHGKVVICEADDSDRLPDWHPAKEGTDPQKNPRRSRDWRHRCFQASDALSVSTPALADEYSWHHTVRVLPNFLFWEMWASQTPVYEARDWERLRVGWLGRSEWRSEDLAILKPWLHDWLVANPDVDFVAAGDEQVHDILGIPEAQRVSFPQVKFPVGLAKLTASFDIGLVPLARGDDVARHFNDCKSHLKGMEYGACGIPYIASPSAPYRWFTTGNGLLADSSADWVAALDGLVGDQGLRQRMGRVGREKAAANAIEDHWQLWEEFYQGLIEKKGRQLTWRAA